MLREHWRSLGRMSPQLRLKRSTRKYWRCGVETTGAARTLMPTWTISFENLNTPQIRSVVSMFENNSRVRSELFQIRPKAQAVALLERLRNKLSLTLHQ